MDVNRLKSVMILRGDEDFVNAISSLLGISRQTASAKLKRKSEFTRTEIAVIAKHYSLTDEQIKQIFIEGEDSNDSQGSS